MCYEFKEKIPERIQEFYRLIKIFEEVKVFSLA